jgi:hypothetical protein
MMFACQHRQGNQPHFRTRYLLTTQGEGFELLGFPPGSMHPSLAAQDTLSSERVPLATPCFSKANRQQTRTGL